MEIDWSVGQILNTLKAQGLEKNTLVIVTSDNGPWFNFGNHAGSTGGFREGKGTTFEGGHRVPCLMRWPGRIPAGTVCNQLSATLDILPTIASLCQLQLPQHKIDGVDLSPLLRGELDANPRQTFYYYYRRNALEAVRMGNWKLVLEHPGRTYEGFKPGKDGYPGTVNENAPVSSALYDLRRDPGERYDVKEVYPQLVLDLQKLAETAREDLGDDLSKRIGKNVRPAGVLRE
jgi:arylsulfatase